MSRPSKKIEIIENKIAGLDVGTGNLVSTLKNEDQTEIKSLRNNYLLISSDDVDESEILETDLNYIELKNSSGVIENIAILGEDAHKFASIFGKEPKRPMQQGVINKSDIDALEILSRMVESLIGKSKNGYCVYSVPAQAIDINMPPVLFHEKVFEKILTGLGYESKSLNEAMAIIFNECASTKFTGVAISYGAGLQNIAVSYKGIPSLTFSIGRSGDWIDRQVAESTDTPISRVTNIKEKKLDLINQDFSNLKRKEHQVIEALHFFYNDLIEYSLKTITQQVKNSSDNLEIDEEIPIIISGGTSMAPGFVDIFKSNFEKFKDFPYDISEIRQAKDPLSAVATGCLIKSMHDMKNK